METALASVSVGSSRDWARCSALVSVSVGVFGNIL